MTTLNRIASWLLWLLCAFVLTQAVLTILVDPFRHNLTLITPEQRATQVETSWGVLGFWSVTGFSCYFLRYHFWFRRNRRARVGFLAVTTLFYLSIIGALGARIKPFNYGDRGAIHWYSTGLGAILFGLGFPRLPPQSLTPRESVTPEKSTEQVE